MVLALYGQDGTEDFDRVLAAVVDDGDDSVVLTGYSSGDWSGTSSAWDDCVAVKLDANGNELWRWQVYTSVQYVYIYVRLTD